MPNGEREHLVQERLRIENRMEALLFTQGIRGRPSLRSWERDIAELRTGDGRALPCLMQAELNRLQRRLVLILELIHEMEAERAEALSVTVDDVMTQKIKHLQRIRGIGANFSAVLVREVLYRSFGNRRQLASYVGIAPMPYQSGGMDRDRSISRAGNPRARTTLIQLAWLWLRYQPGKRAFHMVPWPRRNATRAHASDRHRGNGEKAFDRALALRRDRRDASWRRVRGRGRSHGLTNTIVAGGITTSDDTGNATVFFFGSFRLPRFRWVASTRAKPRV
jgi:transposase